MKCAQERRWNGREVKVGVCMYVLFFLLAGATEGGPATSEAGQIDDGGRATGP